MANKTKHQDIIQRELAHTNFVIEQGEVYWGWKSPAGKLRKRRRLDFFKKYSSLSHLKVLEIGCGTGEFSTELAKVYSQLIAIDLSECALSMARKKTSQVNFKCMDAHQIFFPDHSFDLVLGCSVLHHLNWEMAIKEILRILKPGGKIIFSEPNLYNPQIYLQKNWPWLKRKMGDSPDEYAFSSREMKSVLEKNNFEQIKVTAFEFLHPSTPEKLIPAVKNIEKILERTFMKNIAGSLLIEAMKKR